MSDFKLQLLTNKDTKCKTKSVLNRSASFAAKNMFDGSLDSCWNSDQGFPQHILIDFEKSVSIKSIQIMFQGGFVGQVCSVQASDSLELKGAPVDVDDFDDNNDVQVVVLADFQIGRYFKINFCSSTDFYGRITVYKLEIYGCSYAIPSLSAAIEDDQGTSTIPVLSASCCEHERSVAALHAPLSDLETKVMDEKANS